MPRLSCIYRHLRAPTSHSARKQERFLQPERDWIAAVELVTVTRSDSVFAGRTCEHLRPLITVIIFVNLISSTMSPVGSDWFVISEPGIASAQTSDAFSSAFSIALIRVSTSETEFLRSWSAPVPG